MIPKKTAPKFHGGNRTRERDRKGPWTGTFPGRRISGRQRDWDGAEEADDAAWAAPGVTKVERSHHDQLVCELRRSTRSAKPIDLLPSSLGTQGVCVQRLLWASTSTKNPDYRDVYCVEALIGA